MRKLVIAAAMAMSAVPGIAHADAGPGNITSILTVIDSHSVLFNQSGTRSNIPGCGQGLPVRWAIDTLTPYGQSQLAILLSAYALHKQISIVGMSSCEVHNDTETVRFMNIID